MSVSKTSVINKALTLCGASPITNITDDTNNARIVNRVYEISLKSTLTECKWNFATTRGTLSLSANTISWMSADENYLFVRPAACLRIFEMSDPQAIWREEGDYIISNTAGLGVKYVWYLDDPSKYPAFFLEAFVDNLCVNISFMILNSNPKAEAFLTKYTKISLPNAKSANSQIGAQQIPMDDAWLGAKTANGNPARSYDS